MKLRNVLIVVKDIVTESNAFELYFEERNIEAFSEKLEKLYPNISYVNKLSEYSWGTESYPLL